MSDVATSIAVRVAGYLKPGEVVNLGIGIPTLVADFLDLGDAVHVQSENGLLGVGPAPAAGEADPLIVNAGKLPVTALPGASYFSSSASFGLIRGGHIETAVLGALQVDATGRIANWAVPGRPILGVGGAMDLLVGARRVIVATTHTTRVGAPKLVAACSFPLSAERQVDLVITEAASFQVRDGALVLIEVARSFSLPWVEAHTDAPFTVELEGTP